MKNDKKWKKYWWIVPNEAAFNDAYVNYSVALKYSNFTKLKGVVWKIFRKSLDNKELAARDKIVFWVICERLRGSSFSCWDSWTYIGKVCGLNRHTVSKAISNLVEANLIWIAIEGEQAVGKTRLEPQKRLKKHVLIVGLGKALHEALMESDGPK